MSGPITYHSDPPVQTTVVSLTVHHLVPIGSKFHATALACGRVGTVLGLGWDYDGPHYVVSYDDAPTEKHRWGLRYQYHWTWWDAASRTENVEEP